MGILLFNSIGYQGLLQYLQQQASRQAQAQIDEGSYQTEALLEMSVPLSLPYTTNWSEWEHFEGDIEIDGIHYRYVERKLTEGRMYVRCLPNTAKQQVVNARDEFLSLAFSMNAATPKEKNNLIFISNYIGDYDNTLPQWMVAPMHYISNHAAIFKLQQPPMPCKEAPLRPPAFLT